MAFRYPSYNLLTNSNTEKRHRQNYVTEKRHQNNGSFSILGPLQSKSLATPLGPCSKDPRFLKPNVSRYRVTHKDAYP